MPGRQLETHNGKDPSCLDIFCGQREVVLIETKRQFIGKQEVL